MLAAAAADDERDACAAAYADPGPRALAENPPATRSRARLAARVRPAAGPVDQPFGRCRVGGRRRAGRDIFDRWCRRWRWAEVVVVAGGGGAGRATVSAPHEAGVRIADEEVRAVSENVTVPGIVPTNETRSPWFTPGPPRWKLWMLERSRTWIVYGPGVRC